MSCWADSPYFEIGEGDGKISVDKIARKAEDYRPGERVTHKIS